MKDKTAGISIVIPLYNKAEYVARTINSVIAQTYPYFEALIIDDASTDNGLTIVESFADYRIKIVRQDKNRGVSAARNRGIQEAKYDLIALLDADDWWDNLYLEEMMELVQEYPNVGFYGSQYGMVINGIVHSFSKVLQKNQTAACFDLISMANNSKFPIHSSSVLFKKDIARSSGLFDERITFFEDYDFFLRMALLSKLAYIEKRPLSFYNQDVEKTNRLTGELPSVRTHLLFFLNKYDTLYSKNFFLRSYICQFILHSLWKFRHDADYLMLKKHLIPPIPLKEFSWKQIIYYYFPIGMLDFLVILYKKIKRL